jgi:hypothetical protein
MNVCVVRGCGAAGVVLADTITTLFGANHDAVLCGTCAGTLTRIEKN